MITGFEEYTHELTDIEWKAMPDLIDCIKTKIGKKMATTNGEIQDYIFDGTGVIISSPRIRKMINVLRRSGRVPIILSTGKGYFRAHTAGEVQDYLKSLHERIDAQIAIKNAIQKQYLEGKERHDNENIKKNNGIV